MKKLNKLITNQLINERLNQLDQLTEVIEVFIGIPLDNRVWPLVKKRRLILMTDDPHLATQARFLQKNLCNHINKKLKLNLSGLDIKLLTLPLASNNKKIRRKKINEGTIKVINSIAEGIEDAELQAILGRIAEASQNKNTAY